MEACQIATADDSRSEGIAPQDWAELLPGGRGLWRIPKIGQGSPLFQNCWELMPANFLVSGHATQKRCINVQLLKHFNHRLQIALSSRRQSTYTK